MITVDYVIFLFNAEVAGVLAVVIGCGFRDDFPVDVIVDVIVLQFPHVFAQLCGILISNMFE